MRNAIHYSQSASAMLICRSGCVFWIAQLVLGLHVLILEGLERVVLVIDPRCKCFWWESKHICVIILKKTRLLSAWLKWLPCVIKDYAGRVDRKRRHYPRPCLLNSYYLALNLEFCFTTPLSCEYNCDALTSKVVWYPPPELTMLVAC